MAEIIRTPHRNGLCKIPGNTTVFYLDCTAYVGRYVKIYSEKQDFHFAWNSTASGAILYTEATTPTALVPDAVVKGIPTDQIMIDGDEPFLVAQMDAGTDGILRVIPTSTK
jgi:hypothetical protein